MSCTRVSSHPKDCLFFYLYYICITSAMVGLSLFGRQVVVSPAGHHPRSESTGTMSEEDRREYVSKALVVKHVIPISESDTASCMTVTSLTVLDEENQHPSDHELLADDDDVEQQKPEQPQEQQEQQRPSPRHVSYRRLKSDLIVSSTTTTTGGGDDSSSSSSSSSSQTSTCVICLNPYDIGQEICWSQNPNCRHVFHRDCIEAWLLKHDECPCCRTNYFGDRPHRTSSSSAPHSPSSPPGDDVENNRRTPTSSPLSREQIDSLGTHLGFGIMRFPSFASE
jgi:hypothetical protein